MAGFVITGRAEMKSPISFELSMMITQKVYEGEGMAL